MSIFISNNQILLAQKKNQDTTNYAVKAITEAVKIYHSQKQIGYSKYMVITMKLMKINETSGEFVLRNIWMTSISIYEDFQPTHYVMVNNEILLIKIDNYCNCNPKKYGINIITKDIKDRVLDLDVIKGPKRLAITGQPAPYLVVIYKRDKLNSHYYVHPSWPKKKYWF